MQEGEGSVKVELICEGFGTSEVRVASDVVSGEKPVSVLFSVFVNGPFCPNERAAFSRMSLNERLLH